MKTEQLIIKLKNHEFDEAFKKAYADESVFDKQIKRYVDAVEKFVTLYGEQDVEIYSTPGRSEVCGNHTDHQHGEVLAAAINLDIIAVVTKTKDRIKVVSDGYDITPISLDDVLKKEEEIETSQGLIRGVCARYQELGFTTGGFNAYMTSEVLQGSGLSSSAAFEVMISTILSGLYNDMSIDPVTIAKVGQYSENVYFGKPCGLMDQCACSVGSLIHIDFKDNKKPIVTKVDIDFSAFNHSLCIVDVHASHADLTAEYASIPYEMNKVAKFFGKDILREVDEKSFYEKLPDIRKATNDRAVLRTIHLFEENKRVQKAITALHKKDFDTFKEVIKASGESSYKYLQNIYANNHPDNQAIAIALAVSEKILQENGVCRVHGGGFAGTIQAFVKDGYVEIYKKEIEKYFGEGSCHVLKVRSIGGMKVC